MEEYFLAVLSKHNNQEGYLDIVFDKFEKLGLASRGFDNNNDKLMYIVYDKEFNPYLFFKKRDFKIVEEELLRKIIIPKGRINLGGFKELIDLMELDIHKSILEKNPGK